MSGFRHIALFRWTEGTTTGQQDEVAAKLRELPGAIPEIREYGVGVNAGVNPGAFDFAVVADFADLDAYSSTATIPCTARRSTGTSRRSRRSARPSSTSSSGPARKGRARAVPKLKPSKRLC